jgi:hypothetical protein
MDFGKISLESMDGLPLGLHSKLWQFGCGSHKNRVVLLVHDHVSVMERHRVINTNHQVKSFCTLTSHSELHMACGKHAPKVSWCQHNNKFGLISFI